MDVRKEPNDKAKKKGKIYEGYVLQVALVRVLALVGIKMQW